MSGSSTSPYQTWSPSIGGDEGADPSSAPAASPSEAERYEIKGELGRGGMGEVLLAYDARLARELALKVSHAPSTAAAAGLLREATTTARLEHPSIVPVYDAGRLEDGRPYYTMPVLHGRSLADRIHESPTLAARLRLLRAFVDACEAVAYAHSQGVVHRDLKPANIMVGTFGETRVVDWGVASAMGGPPSEIVVGTPSYMSPEQAEGAPVAASFDVYSLGATLHELLTGSRPRAGLPPDADIPPVRSRCPEVPPELAAVADRATQADPALRYPSAGALAEDVEAWFEGRRVGAYSYTLRELLRRFVVTWRVPIGVGLVMGAWLVLALVGGWRNTRAERNRAVAAEAAAVEARRASDAYLSRALLAQAQVAADLERRSDAEILAAHSLALTPSPEARGILARYGLEPRPQVSAVAPLVNCMRALLSPSGRSVTCIRPEGLEVTALDAPQRVIARRVGPIQTAEYYGEDALALVTADRRLIAWSLLDGRETDNGSVSTETHLISGVSGSAPLVHGHGFLARRQGEVEARLVAPICDGHVGVVDAIGLGDGVAVYLCGDGWLGTVGVEGGALDNRVDPALGQVTLLALDQLRPDRVAVGTEKGWAVIQGLDGREVWRTPEGGMPLSRLILRGDRLVVGSSGGLITVWEPSTGRLIARLPYRMGPIALVEEGARLRTTTPDGVVDWSLPVPDITHVLQVDGGVSALDISADGAQIAVGLGDGSVRVLARVGGAERWRVYAGGGVAKDVAFSPDGAELLTGGADGDGGRYATAAGALRVIPSLAVRRVGWLPSGVSYFAPYTPELVLVYPEGGQRVARPLALPTRVGDIADWPDGRGAVLVDQEDQLWQLALDGPAPELTPLGAVPETRGVTGSKDAIWVAYSASVDRLDGAGQRTGTIPLAASAVNVVAVSPDQQLLAIGLLNGEVTLWSTDDLTLLATLRGHTGRVSALAFAPDSRWLATGSWDQTVRLWDMQHLRQDPAQLIGPLEAAWGRDLDAVLAP